jgi:hypothetical protein
MGVDNVRPVCTHRPDEIGQTLDRRSRLLVETAQVNAALCGDGRLCSGPEDAIDTAGMAPSPLRRRQLNGKTFHASEI